MKKIKIGMVGLNWGNAIIRDQILQGPASELFELAAVCCQGKAKVDECAKVDQGLAGRPAPCGSCRIITADDAF